MTKKPGSDKIYVAHILDEIARIERFAAQEAGEMQDWAVTRSLEIIGEASNNVSDILRLRHPDIPWRDVVDIRNALIHGYFGVSYERVWNVVRGDLPMLKKQLELLIKELDKPCP